jgi:hypothetical protein
VSSWRRGRTIRRTYGNQGELHSMEAAREAPAALQTQPRRLLGETGLPWSWEYEWFKPTAR